MDPLSPLTVGNGRFCYTADVTGLQTLRAEYGSGIPLCTMAEWGWNSHPNTTRARREETVRKVWSGDREVPYLVNQDAEAASWLRANPIYYAELLYRHDANRDTLNAYRDVVFETAELMADFARWNEECKCFDLGPPLIPAQENHPPDVTGNQIGHR